MLVKLLVAFSMIVGLGIVLAVGLIVAPEIDERAGFFTGRATKAIQQYTADGVPLHRVVDLEFRDAKWRGYHQDVFFQTFVECVGKPRMGGPERRMVWYVEERPTWNHGPSISITIMTALNGDALQLTPHLFDPHAGYGLEQWRH